MNLKNRYLGTASGLSRPEPFGNARSVGWRSPSNIALIKYWGKKADQIPQNPSLSFTLSNSFTETTVEYSFAGNGSPGLDFLFEGKPNLFFENRIRKYLNTVWEFLPFLPFLKLHIRSSNSFPHSSGIASSASAMSALALCLADIENELFRTLDDQEEFLRKAAFLARLGSGSATRSVYGGFVLWGKTELVTGSSDEAGCRLPLGEGIAFSGLKDAILITSMDRKKVSSTHGHRMMEDHPWASSRYAQANSNLRALHMAMKEEKEEEFIHIIENEALSLHALMLSSDPGYRLMNQNTWNIIDHIRDYREKTGLFIAFTLDAGPNVHMIYKQDDHVSVQEFIRKNLVQFCENGYWIDDGTGNGPVKI